MFSLKPINVVAIILLCVASCAAAGNKKFYVADRKINCAGAYQCYQLKAKSKDTWHVYADTIAGFNYEEGYEYRLLLKPIQTASAFAGIYDEKYELVKVLAKRKTGYKPQNGPGDKKWILRSIDEAGHTQNMKDTISFIRINEKEGKISGRGTCNTFSSKVEIQGNSVSIGAIQATKMFCPLIDTERAIFIFFGKVNSYRVQGNTLTLLQPDGSKMVFTTP
jgi:heat shock protein HslJ